ncbi:MAG TPA: hypothetical protein VKV20_19960 [Ktedonobacteraceae bacterium]|jgi:hemoglobin|nr:hypothetical protein [Ktedonobacteraceae bacterium]
MTEIEPEPDFPASTADSPGVDLYSALGGIDTCRRLVAAFYAHVEHDPVLRPLYPPTLKGCPIEALADFFIQFFGGPCVYAPRRWSLSLYEAHLRFAIGQRERAAWLTNMFQAIDDVKIEEPARSALRWFFAQSSAFMINQPAEAASKSPALLEHPIPNGRQNELEPSHLHQDIKARWQAQQLLEEMIVAARQGNADVVLAVIEHPVMQASFHRDRAAFLSFLAILSGSNSPALHSGTPSTTGRGPQCQGPMGAHTAISRRQHISWTKWSGSSSCPGSRRSKYQRAGATQALHSPPHGSTTRKRAGCQSVTGLWSGYRSAR